MPLVYKKYKIHCVKNTATGILNSNHPKPGRRIAVISRKYHAISVRFLPMTELTSRNQIFMTMYDENLSLHFRLHIIIELDFGVLLLV